MFDPTVDTFASLLTQAMDVIINDLHAAPLLAAGGIAGLAMFFLRRVKSAIR